MLIKSDTPAKFPDWKAIFPKHGSHKGEVFSFIDRDGIACLAQPYTQLVRLMDETQTISIQYFEDAVINHDLTWAYHGPKKAVEFWNDRHFGLIMPMSVKRV